MTIPRVVGYCVECDKVCYSGRRVAERKAKYARRKRQRDVIRMVAYRCKAGRWHVGRSTGHIERRAAWR